MSLTSPPITSLLWIFCPYQRPLLLHASAFNHFCLVLDATCFAFHLRLCNPLLFPTRLPITPASPYWNLMANMRTLNSLPPFQWALHYPHPIQSLCLSSRIPFLVNFLYMVNTSFTWSSWWSFPCTMRFIILYDSLPFSVPFRCLHHFILSMCVNFSTPNVSSFCHYMSSYLFLFLCTIPRRNSISVACNIIFKVYFVWGQEWRSALCKIN